MNTYALTEQDRALLIAAKSLLEKVLHSDQLDPVETRHVTELHHALVRLPRVTHDLEVRVSVSSPRRNFGDIETWHWWDVALEFGVLRLSSGGHFYWPASGGDTFTTMTWEASPGEAGDFTDYRDNLRIVPDICSYEEGVARIDFGLDGFEVEITAIDDEQLEDVSAEKEDDSSRGAAASSPKEQRADGKNAGVGGAGEASGSKAHLERNGWPMQLRQSAFVFVAIVVGMLTILGAVLAFVMTTDQPEQYWQAILLVCPFIAGAGWLYWPRLKPVFRCVDRWLPAVLFFASISFSPYRAPAERFYTPVRIFRPIYYPPSEGEYRLDITLLGAQWVAIGIIAFGLHRLRSAPPK